MICFQSQECEKYHKPIHMFGQTHGCLTGLKQKVPFCWAAHDKITGQLGCKWACLCSPGGPICVGHGQSWPENQKGPPDSRDCLLIQPSTFNTHSAPGTNYVLPI
jgi:hypothetical protein